MHNRKKILDDHGLNIDGEDLIRKEWAEVKDAYFSKNYHMFTKLYPAIPCGMFLVFFKKQGGEGIWSI